MTSKALQIDKRYLKRTYEAINRATRKGDEAKKQVAICRKKGQRFRALIYRIKQRLYENLRNDLCAELNRLGAPYDR